MCLRIQLIGLWAPDRRSEGAAVQLTGTTYGPPSLWNHLELNSPVFDPGDRKKAALASLRGIARAYPAGRWVAQRPIPSSIAQMSLWRVPTVKKKFLPSVVNSGRLEGRAGSSNRTNGVGVPPLAGTDQRLE